MDVSLFGKPPFLILHLPHSSTVIPPEIRHQFSLTDAELGAELLAMTDHYTDELFRCREAHARVVFPVSRLVLDPERFEDDDQEAMAARGMGVVYTLTSTGAPLRYRLSLEDRSQLIDRYYRPHHDALTQAVDSSLAAWGSALIVDCHSFPTRPHPYEPVQIPVRPDICIGTDPYHTPDWLRDHTCELFRKAGLTVAVNTPFAGALVPTKHYRKTPKVRSIMIELNRGLYMDETSGERTVRFGEITKLLETILPELAEVSLSQRGHA